MEWFKKHADTIVILGSFALCFWTINEKMNDRFSSIDNRFSSIDNRLSVIETVLIIKDIMPKELAKELNK